MVTSASNLLPTHVLEKSGRFPGQEEAILHPGEVFEACNSPFQTELWKLACFVQKHIFLQRPSLHLLEGRWCLLLSLQFWLAPAVGFPLQFALLLQVLILSHLRRVWKCRLCLQLDPGLVPYYQNDLQQVELFFS